MVPQQIEKEVVIDAPVAVVWSIVTEPSHIGGWFSDTAEVDLRPGGAARLTWEEHGTVTGRVERVEPPRYVAFRWLRETGERDPEELGEGNSTLVEFSLSPAGDGTRLRVVESGFDRLDGDEAENAKHAEGNTRGWEHELGELVDYAAKHAGAAARG